MYKFLFIALIFTCISARAEEIRGTVTDAESNKAVAYATITVEYADTIIGCISDKEGAFRFIPHSFPLTIKAKSFGMVPDSIRLDTYPDRPVIITLSPLSKELDEVVVVGHARLTSLNDTGLSYKMSGNERAQTENTLQSLSYVPLIDVSPDGEIKVQGSSAYSLYLNGRPYEMAQTSPKAFLETLPASAISKVEVITNPTHRFGPSASRYIINIVLKNPLVEGYTVNLSAGGNTQPCANGSLLGMIHKNKVDASLTYDYGLNGQRNQPVNITYSIPDADGNASRSWETDSRSDGDWHTHTMRAMLKWQIDSLNTLYADAHGRINRTDMTGAWRETMPTGDNGSYTTYLDNTSKYTSGTTEANLIYRHYSPRDKNSERFTLGYHFTYNPDRRRMTQHRYGSDREDSEAGQDTDGGMTEHSGLASYLWQISTRHSIRFSAKDMYRMGRTHSTDISEAKDESRYSMNYRNNVAEGSASYSGYVGKVMIEAGIKFNHDYFRMRLPQTPADNFSNTHFYLMPSGMVYWMPNNNHAFMLNYSTDISRPSVQMLNPFVSTTNDYSISHGNPQLKAQYTHDVSLNWFYNGVHNLSLVIMANYSHYKDLIQSYKYFNTDNKLVYTYGNLGTGNQALLLFNLKWDIKDWLTFSVDGNGGWRHLSASDIGLDQKDWFYNVTPKVDFLLPKHYRLGGSLGLYKSLPDPWSSQNLLKIYSFYVGKSFLNGRLNVSATANSPFHKYHKSIADTKLPDIHSRQTNYITARSFGINLSYSFGSGQKVNIQRDQIMRSADQTTGVN
ncbi:MAG: outer membrane beta-barrel family protein [Bacteroidales bacterium]|nr:outer membrane beta-barrel family protein [Bacteroidales bacterium]